ncbi:Acyltransferase family protein [Lentzea waywayandensis]|uniref:Acyltransferase family protein n=1 Tax=Lentzea waywayandensis TaxID=84724 RepID=A0A1I6FE41_9PSEU|nr:acyltransferase [Lentzea waywayandensis]SFR28259.1 Acyltransferase family protein [Lentzea waywayandensis]
MRLSAVDNLKVILVAWVIGGHALLGYAAIGGWPYDEVNEVTFHPGVETVLAALIGPSGLFFMGTFYFMAGIFTPGSIERKGRQRFIAERLVRLGTPWVVSAVVVWPTFVWIAYNGAGRDVSWWQAFTGRQPFLDSGSLWFVGVLLIFSIAIALAPPIASVVSVFGREGGRKHSRPRPSLLGIGTERTITPRTVVGMTMIVAGTTFLTRLVFPARSGQVGDLHLWWWPQCLGMLLLGAIGGHKLAERVPDEIYRMTRNVVVGTIAVLPIAAALMGVLDLAKNAEPFLGGLTWQAATLALIEGILVVAGSLWLIGLAQRRLTRQGPFAEGLARSAYVAFVVQGPILLSLATALRPLHLPAEVKAPLVGAGAIALSFAIGWFVTSRRGASARSS